MRYGRFVLGSVMALAAACAQIAGLDDPGDFTAPPPNGAGASSVDGALSSSGDVGSTPPADGSPDVAPSGDGSCATAIFCESFDQDAIAPEWTKSDSGTGAWSLVDNPVRSAPYSFRATNAGNGRAQLTRTVPIADAITCEMSVRMKAWSGEAYFFELGLDPADKGGFDYWWVDVGKLAGEAIILVYSWNGSETNNYSTFNAPPNDTWVRVGIDVRLRGGTPEVVVRFDGKEVGKRGIDVPSSTTYRLSIGLGTDKNATADDVFIDDVSCFAR